MDGDIHLLRTGRRGRRRGGERQCTEDEELRRRSNIKENDRSRPLEYRRHRVKEKRRETLRKDEAESEG